MDTMWEGEYGTNRENNLKTHTLPYVKQTAGGKLLYNTGSLTLRSVTTQKAGRCRGWEGEDRGILMAASHSYTVETNKTLLSNYPPIKGNFFF